MVGGQVEEGSRIRHDLEGIIVESRGGFLYHPRRRDSKSVCATLLEKAKLAREICDGKNEIPHKFLGRKI